MRLTLGAAVAAIADRDHRAKQGMAKVWELHKRIYKMAMTTAAQCQAVDAADITTCVASPTSNSHTAPEPLNRSAAQDTFLVSDGD